MRREPNPGQVDAAAAKLLGDDACFAEGSPGQVIAQMAPADQVEAARELYLELRERLDAWDSEVSPPVAYLVLAMLVGERAFEMLCEMHGNLPAHRLQARLHTLQQLGHRHHLQLAKELNNVASESMVTTTVLGSQACSILYSLQVIEASARENGRG